MNEKIMFTTQTLTVDDGRPLGSAIKDEDGYFTDVPLAAFDVDTRNATSYDTAQFIKQMTDANSSFVIRLQEGNLIGEWGHPYVNMESRDGLRRLLHLEPSKEALSFRKITTKKLDDLGIMLVVGDTKPTGPFGRYYDEAMTDPTRNAAHSLRGVSTGRVNPKTGVAHKYLQHLATFDAGVPGGGFKYSSKRYMSSTEGITMDVGVNDVVIEGQQIQTFHQIAMESFTDTELNEIFKSKKVVLGRNTFGVMSPGEVIDNEGKASLLMHQLLRR